ncbi:MAG: hypothetical protein GY847_23610 [Proteobacteria bacterium]|nr:hypothetical protein [Pseudomonadota bacterium]
MISKIHISSNKVGYSDLLIDGILVVISPGKPQTPTRNRTELRRDSAKPCDSSLNSFVGREYPAIQSSQSDSQKAIDEPSCVAQCLQTLREGTESPKTLSRMAMAYESWCNIAEEDSDLGSEWLRGRNAFWITFTFSPECIQR